MAASKPPIPEIPSTMRIPNYLPPAPPKKDPKKPYLEVPTTTQFYYTGIQSMWLWWLVDLKHLHNVKYGDGGKHTLEDIGMTPYDFGGGKGLVNVNFFNAVATYGAGQPGNPGEGGFNETELNVVCHASAVSRLVPRKLSVEEFLQNGEPTKRLGNMRLWVACDNEIAVIAGKTVFMENKFLTPYTYDVPNLNNPGHQGGPHTWTWTCHDPEDDAPKECIYAASVDLDGLSPTVSNMSEWIDLSWDQKSKRPVASRRNFFGMYHTFHLPRGSKAVSLSYGKSDHPMRKDMKKLIGRKKPIAVQTFVSPPVIAEWAGYYADL